MKLVIAVVNNDDSAALIRDLSEHEIGSTRLATTGGFLRAGNTTLLVGTADEKLPEVMDIIANNCKMRKEMVSSAAMAPFGSGIYNSTPIEVTIGGATVFVMDVEKFEKM